MSATSPQRSGSLPARSWDEEQRTYWNDVAPSYDAFYLDQWSAHENRAVVQRLSRHLPTRTETVLDLGCGTGLGASLLGRALGRPVRYYGLDVSESMLECCHTHVPEAELALGTMTDLSGYGDESFDAVTAFFGAGSYAESVSTLLKGARRVLRPGGVMYLSFFGRWALRRLARGRLGPLERYHTRHERKAAPPPVRVHTKPALLAAARGGGAFRGSYVVEGQGALAGLVEAPWAWVLSRAVDRALPALSHQLELIAPREGAPSPP